MTKENVSEKSMGGNAPPNLFLQYLVFGVVLLIGIGSILIMAYPLFSNEGKFLEKMADPEVARGVITFIFVLGTITVAILLTLAILLRQSPIKEIEQRYRLGRETLSILIGVVGTIIGFYFGTTSGSAPDPATAQDGKPPVEIVVPKTTETNSATAQNGKPPVEIVVPKTTETNPATVQNGKPPVENVTPKTTETE